MFSPSLNAVLTCLAFLMGVTPCCGKPLVICADPDNPPFSSRRLDGFDNKIAELVGRQLGVPVRFHWARAGRGFVREVLNKGACDAVVGIPVGIRGMLATRPYYRSSYVVVTSRDKRPVSSLDESRLRQMRIGVQVLDDDYAPPARALARRGLANNIVGFTMDQNAGKIISAVADGEIGAAIVWGPLAGYYSRKFGPRLRMVPVTPAVDPPELRFTYEIAIGVRKDNPELQRRLDSALAAIHPQIERVLRAYHVPLLPFLTSVTEMKPRGGTLQ